MGDVLAITDTEGNIVGNYEYDAWGKVLTADTDIAKQNPIRYRGYYYDNETGYYYLQSRYYDSNICRFINADIAEISQKSKDISSGTNLFVYCNNDSINNSDPNGYWVVRAAVAAASAAIFGGIAYAIARKMHLTSRQKAIFTAAFTAAGGIIGAIWGIKILTKINKLIKPVIYWFSNPGKVYFGIKLLSKIQFELHNPHHGKGIHFVIRIFVKGTAKQIFEYVFRK